MKKKTKCWLIAATILVVAGGLLFSGVMMLLKWDFSKLSTAKYETNEYELQNDYRHIEIVTDTADIVFVPSENGKTSVVCYEKKKVKHTVSIEGETLTVKVKDVRKWYEHIGFDFGSPKITVYLPKSEYDALTVKSDTGNVTVPAAFSLESMNITISTGNVATYASVSGDVRIKTSTGNIRAEGLSTGTLDLSVSTGKVTVTDVACKGNVTVRVSTGKMSFTNVTCRNLSSEGSTGNVSLQNVLATETLSIKRSTGDVKFEGCDAAELLVETDTGNVKGSLLSEKIFFAKSDTGRVNVPESLTGGPCKITTDTGDIRIEIRKDI